MKKLTRCFVPTKTRLQVSCFIEMANITPCFNGPTIPIRYVEDVDRRVQYPSSRLSIWASSLVQFSDDTPMSDHNNSLSCNSKQETLYI
jgi:hypothetical protein